jgi:hypothetical protein
MFSRSIRSRLSAAFVSLASAALLVGFAGSAAAQASKRVETPALAKPGFTFNGVNYASQRAFIESGARCSTRIPTEAQMAVASENESAWAAARVQRGQSVENRPVGSVTIQTWVHIIQNAAGTNPNNGYVSDTQVAQQMQILNDAWANSAFRFNLAGTTRTVNAAWYDMSQDAAELAAKTALKRGGVETLNIYVSGLGGGLLGYAYLAQSAAAVGVLDGVVVLNQSLPGGNAAPYNIGDTGTHEVGHWFGLLHTFDGACSRTGDLVADTVPEQSPAFGCPIGRNTCRVARSGDPIFNFMDYTDDACMNMFSRLQYVRMDAQHLQYRTPI